jgi:putative ABC transport system permease protein
MIAFLLFGLLRSLAAAFDQGAEIAGEDRLVSINKISLIQPLPEAYLPKVNALEGVDKATSANWFGGYYQDPKNQFPQFPIIAEDYFEIYKEMIALPEEQMQAWKKNRIGVVICFLAKVVARLGNLSSKVFTRQKAKVQIPALC